MYAFEYHRPASLDDASALLASRDDPKLLAGGMTLIPTLKQRLASPSDVIDLADVPGLRGVREEGDALVIGAFTPHAEVAANEIARRKIPALAKLAAGIGDPQVRNRGTIGGSVANNDPAADYPAALIALDATVETTRRRLTAEEYFQGMFQTALEDDEIITAVRFPAPVRAAYAKFDNPASRYAIVGVFVAETATGVRVGVTGAGQDGVFRATAIEQALAASFTPEAARGVTIDAEGMNADIHASAEYRAHLVSVMASRAVAACG